MTTANEQTYPNLLSLLPKLKKALEFIQNVEEKVRKLENVDQEMYAKLKDTMDKGQIAIRLVGHASKEYLKAVEATEKFYAAAAYMVPGAKL